MLLFYNDYRQTSKMSRTLVTQIYIFINLTPGFNGLSKDNCKAGQEPFKFWNLKI